MKQKYAIMLGENENQVMIKEFAELDKGIFSKIFSAKYARETLQEAVKTGRTALIETFRTPSFFPVGLCAEKIADALTDFLQTDGSEPVEILFDDFESLEREERGEVYVDDDSDAVEIDEILDDEIDDDGYLEDDDIKSISSASTTIRLADEEEGGGAEEEEA